MGDLNGHPEHDPRAYVLAEVGAVIGKKRGGDRKREIATQGELVMAQIGTQITGRACPCLSLHLMSPLRKFVWRKIAQNAEARLAQNSALIMRQEQCVAAQIEL